MLSELHTAHKVIGVKQTKKAIQGRRSRYRSLLRWTRKSASSGPIYELCTVNHGIG